MPGPFCPREVAQVTCNACRLEWMKKAQKLYEDIKEERTSTAFL
jgi:hypothetical protein